MSTRIYAPGDNITADGEREGSIIARSQWLPGYLCWFKDMPKGKAKFVATDRLALTPKRRRTT